MWKADSSVRECWERAVRRGLVKDSSQGVIREGQASDLCSWLSGLEVIGEYKMEKAQFSWIEVTFKNLPLLVHVTPEHVVVTRDHRSSQYKWKETLFVVMPG